jgi:putative flippase GtrA
VRCHASKPVYPDPVPSRASGLTRLLGYHQVRYLVVAGGVALGYLGLLALGLALGWHYFVAILVAQVITIACAFPAYRSFVFGSRQTVARDFVRFLSVWSTGAVAGLVATPFLVEVFGMDPLSAQVLAILVIAVGSYAGHRWFSFSENTKPAPGAGRPDQGPD